MVAKKTAPAKTAAKKPAAKPAPAPAETTEESTFGVANIVELIKVRTGKTTKTRDLRILLRKMARDGRLNREIVAGNRNRWEWTGPEDPEIELIIEAFENGELEEDKQAKLQALKDRKAKEKADKAAAAEAEEAEGDDEELEEE
ncbi:hypothetical protein PBI_TRISCUIT_54 [Microbacterium phage Triscuit]|nr:hypothetical protein PBI_TRISCUIT_54 [Microbacterium phage Triscuit]